MNIDVSEKIWMWEAALVVVVFVAFVGVSTFAQGVHPTSHVETIDPIRMFQDARFSRLGTPTDLPDGTIAVQVALLMFSFVPSETPSAEDAASAGWWPLLDRPRDGSSCAVRTRSTLDVSSPRS